MNTEGEREQIECVPLPDGAGYMIHSPPNAERLRRLKERDFPYTARRIAILEASHYLPLEDAERYGRLFAAAPDLLDACQLAASAIETATNMGVESHGLVAVHRKLCEVLAKASPAPSVAKGGADA